MSQSGSLTFLSKNTIPFKLNSKTLHTFIVINLSHCPFFMMTHLTLVRSLSLLCQDTKSWSLHHSLERESKSLTLTNKCEDMWHGNDCCVKTPTPNVYPLAWSHHPLRISLSHTTKINFWLTNDKCKESGKSYSRISLSEQQMISFTK